MSRVSDVKDGFYCHLELADPSLGILSRTDHCRETQELSSIDPVRANRAH
jgi:hypothetical protein